MLFRLPVSALQVVVRQPTGVEDLLLADAPADDTELALALLEALARLRDGTAAPWASLPVTDLEVGLLVLRLALLGDVVRCVVTCREPGCGEKLDVEFRLGDYLDHHLPEPVDGVRRRDDDPWLELEGEPTSFRIPTAVDRLAAESAADPEAELARRCIRGDVVAPERREVIETALERLAPSMLGELTGVCSACGAAIVGVFDPVSYVLRELRGQAAAVYEDVDAIARFYHWSEREILALPRVRRARYAELIREAAHGG